MTPNQRFKPTVPPSAGPRLNLGVRPHRAPSSRLLDTHIYCSYINECVSSSIQPKDRANQAKHGVSLVLSVELDWEAALVWVDGRFEYTERRMIALAPKTRILYYVAFVDRGEVRRIISLRRANRREVKHYVQRP
jgi:uncharacterized DUF497 family protein